jgi:thiol:disulfide interchange protein
MDVATDRFTVVFIDDDVNVEQMQKAIRSLGYSPTTVGSAIEVISKKNSTEIPEPVLSALHKARASGKLLFLDFQAKWCGACKIMERTTFADSHVQTTLEQFVFLKVDADTDAIATRYYNVVGLPTLVVLGIKGEEKYRHVGPISAEDLNVVLRGLDSMPDKHGRDDRRESKR